MTAGAASDGVLFVFPWCLDRLGHGNIQRVLAMARFLARAGFAVDLVYQGNPAVPSREREFSGFRRVIRVDAYRATNDAAIVREFARFYQGHEAPPANMFPGTALTGVVRGLLDALDYSAVISSYAWTAPIYAPLARRALRVVDLHDVIARHAARALEATGTPSPYTIDAGTERFLWRKFDVVLAITPEEAAIVSPALRPTQRLLTVPHAVQVLDHPPAGQGPVVYVGSDNPSNRRAVTWLLSEVWPRVVGTRPDASLRVVGLIGETIDPALTSARGVTRVGFVEDPAEELRGASLVVAPYLYGSGLKVKVVEAAAAGRALVTTSAGAEGTGLVHGEQVLIADDARGFADAVLRLLDDPALREKLAAAARALVRRRFSDQICYRPLTQVLAAPAPVHVPAGVLLDAAIESRIEMAWQVLERPRVVVWGNGSHTRALTVLMTRLGIPVSQIIDKAAAGPSTSEEGIPVGPPRDLRPNADDLIVLSSQSFESEMWADLAPARAEGAHVLGLYRRELVTPVLGARLRGRERAIARVVPRARVDATGSRLVIVEPSAGRGQGPFLRLAHALGEAAALLGMRVIVAGALETPLDGLDPCERQLLVPTFEYSHWDARPSAGADRWREVTRFASFLGGELAALSAELTISERDVVLFHTANIVEVLGAISWLGRRATGAVPALRLLFHFPLEQEAGWLHSTKDELASVYGLALAQLEELAGGRLRCLAQSELLAPHLEAALGRDIEPMGFPVTARARPAARATAISPRLLYAGEARTDKGFGLLPDVAALLEPELSSGRARLVCQASLNEFAGGALRTAVAALRTRPGVELIDRFLPSPEYDALFTGCDAVVLPYDPTQYRHRLSAVFVEAACAGLPVVVPDGTWMSHQLDVGLGAGERFAERTPAEIAAAVRRVLDSLPALEGAASAAASRVSELHAPSAVLSTILVAEPGERRPAETATNRTTRPN